MQKLLGFLMLFAALAFTGAAVACEFHESASADQSVVTAQVSPQSTAPAAGTTTTTTTTPKTPQANSGG